MSERRGKPDKIEIKSYLPEPVNGHYYTLEELEHVAAYVERWLELVPGDLSAGLKFQQQQRLAAARERRHQKARDRRATTRQPTPRAAAEDGDQEA